MRADGTVHEYCPPEHVASEVDRLIRFHLEHLVRGVSPHIEAAWLHHAFTQIHPFQDGNGRVARTLATLVFIRGGFFPLVVNRDDRTRYIDALESADLGDLAPLTLLFSQIQKRALTKAIGKAVEVRPAATVDEALMATRDMLVDLGKIPKEYLAAQRYAEILLDRTVEGFTKVTSRLTDEIARVGPMYSFQAGTMNHVPLTEIRLIAEKLKYEANVNDFHKSGVITLKAGEVASRIVISFHGVGAAFRGVLVAVAYFQLVEGPAVPLSDDVFRISYLEPQDELLSRFDGWLDRCIIQGIAEWRRTLV
jgi:hypothetical protein